MGLGKEPPKAEAPKKSYAQILLSDADKQRQIGESLRKAGSPNAQQYFDAADKILEKAAPLMKEERQAEMARIKEYGNKLAFCYRSSHVGRRPERCRFNGCRSGV